MKKLKPKKIVWEGTDELQGRINKRIIFCIDAVNRGYSIREVKIRDMAYHNEDKPLKSLSLAKQKCKRLLQKQIEKAQAELKFLTQ